ncbi:MAG: DUF4012 domain-containing protein [Anaerolineae bacterium]
MSVSEETTPTPVAQPMPVAQAVPTPSRRRRSSRGGPRWLRRLTKKINLRGLFARALLLLIVGAVVLGVVALVLVTDATNRVESSVASVTRVVNTVFNRPGTTITLNDFNRLQSSVDELSRTLASAASQTAFLRPVANLDAGLRATVAALDATRELTLAADALLDGLQPTVFFLVGGRADDTVVTQISSGERIVELLRLGRPKFLEAQFHLERANRIVNALSADALPLAALLQLEQINSYYVQISEIQSLLMDAPDLLTSALGLAGDQSYLVLASNSDEIRPSGGYISTYGWLMVRNGRIVDYNYSATTTTTPNPPPAAMSNQIPIPGWWLQFGRPIFAAWDGSWSPDFPTTAQMAMWYYNNGNNPRSPVQGAFAVNIVAFEYILGALGEVRVPEFSVTVTPENFRRVVYDIRAFGEGDTPHKRFLAALYRQIFSDWQAMTNDPQRSAAILSVLLRALQEKHLMLYFTDERLNRAMDLLGWSGRQSAGSSSDYLMVVDTNLGNKSNSSIRRQTTYDVQIQPNGSVDSRLTVLYDYPAAVAANDPAVNPEFHGPVNYNNLAQFFVPPNALLGSVTDSLRRFEQVLLPDHTLFVGRLSVPLDTSQRIQITYTSPDVVETLGDFQRYRLLIEKQPGVRSELVSVQVTMPQGAEVVRVSPEPVATYTLDRQIIEFRFEMVSDVTVEILYR